MALEDELNDIIRKNFQGADMDQAADALKLMATLTGSYYNTLRDMGIPDYVAKDMTISMQTLMLTQGQKLNDAS